MPYILPADVDKRPVVIDGAGTLGTRQQARRDRMHYIVSSYELVRGG
jgi:hypothetical protein